MDIAKLYEELGRADAATIASKRSWEVMEEAHRVERRVLDKAHSAIRDEARTRHKKLTDRLKTLRDAIQLAEGGMDPLIAKIKASGESQASDDDCLFVDDENAECDEADYVDEDDEQIY